MFKLPEGVSEKYARARESLDCRRAVFASLSSNDLKASARFWMQHCIAPRQLDPDSCVYDATFWHVIVPELLNRLSKDNNEVMK